MDWLNILSRLVRPVYGIAGRSAASDPPPRVEDPNVPGSARQGDAQPKAPSANENKQLAKLVDEIESDYQFKFARDTIAALVTTNPVVFEPSEYHKGDARLAAICDNANAMWVASIHHALNAFGYGRAAFEKSYVVNIEANVATLAKLDYLDFKDTEMLLDPVDGSFAGVKLGKEDLPPSQVWWLAIDPTPQNPHGRSRYAGAPTQVRTWRKTLENQEHTWFQRFAIGHGVARFPEPQGADASDAANHPRSKLAEQLTAIESGGVLTLSSQQYTGTDGTPTGSYLYDYDPGEGLRDASALISRRQNLDVCTLRAMSIPEMALQNNGDTGTFAMAEAHQTLLWANADGLQAQIVESFKKYVVDKLVELNYSEVDAEEIKGMVVAKWTTRLKQHEAAATQGASMLPGFGQTTPPSDPTAPGVAAPQGQQVAPADDVAATALNGAQITSLVEVISQTAAGVLPYASARPILEAAFPTLSASVLDRIVKPIMGFDPTPDSPPSVIAKAALLPDRIVKTDEQIAAAGQRDAREIYADLQDILSDRVAMKDAIANPVGEPRRRL